MARIESFRDLIVWQRAMAMAEGVYRLTSEYPRDEQFGLVSQTRRAAVSVAANIAEGHGRGTRAAYAGFLRIARGSLREVETHLLLASRLGMGSGEQIDGLLVDAGEIGRMLHTLIARLREQPALP
ncbi:MAG: four helix bundle protein [Sphingomonas sp.]|uniref:four helix bundle protein n=1 Tax=Sphingomonas sp. TaxID=28214 RepID=UPI001ACE4250|nr:four helix bundle protein [Sphingomonas sp.]MBN8809600.1 four helix bundle protein [Sphingomonas sp.]